MGRTESRIPVRRTDNDGAEGKAQSWIHSSGIGRRVPEFLSVKSKFKQGIVRKNTADFATVDYRPRELAKNSMTRIARTLVLVGSRN